MLTPLDSGGDQLLFLLLQGDHDGLWEEGERERKQLSWSIKRAVLSKYPVAWVAWSGPRFAHPSHCLNI